MENDSCKDSVESLYQINENKHNLSVQELDAKYQE